MGITIQTRITVPSAVTAIITKNQPIYECLKQRLINYHALAARIKPEVGKLTGRETSTNTIVVAIKRFSDTLPRVEAEEPFDLLNDARITLASGITHVTITAKKSEFPILLKQLSEISASLNEPPHIFQLTNSVKVIADAGDYETSIRPKLRKWRISKEETDLSKLSLHLPPEAERTPGFASLITELLYRSGINILNIYVGEETILILDRNDGAGAYEILEREIVRSKKSLARGEPPKQAPRKVLGT